jgi:hypothetical protein
MRLFTGPRQIIEFRRRWARACVRLLSACTLLAFLSLMLADDFGYLESALWRMDRTSHLLTRYVPFHVSGLKKLFTLDIILLINKH